MTTTTLRLGASLAAAVRDVAAAEDVGESTALRKLLHLGYRVYLAEQYRAGLLSLRDVAGRMEVPLGDALDALQRLGICGNVSAADMLDSLGSVEETVVRS